MSGRGFYKGHFDYFDLGVVAAMNPRTFTVWLCLRRFIRRDDPEDEALTAVVSQATLATLVGVDARSVRRALNDLKSILWVRQTSEGISGEVQHYRLGTRVADDADPTVRHELLYADGWLVELQQLIEESTGLDPHEVSREDRVRWARLKLRLDSTRAEQQSAPGVVVELSDFVGENFNPGH